MTTRKIIFVLLTMLAVSCGSRESEQQTQQELSPDSLETEVLIENDPIDEILGLTENWTGDLDGMIERRQIRALVIYSKTFYFLDGAQRRGLTYEALKAFESHLNQEFKKIAPILNIIFVPVARDQLIPALLEGRGDIAAANLTITPERQELVDFSDPLLKNVNEIVVTGPASPHLSKIDDLAGKEVYIRGSSSYYESLNRLSDSLVLAGNSPIGLQPADEYLEDEDLLEMVNAGLIPMTVVDSHKGAFWQDIFDSIEVRQDLVVNAGGEVAWAFRKNSPQLEEAINAFAKKHKAGTLFGNVLLNRYLRDNPWVRNATAEEEVKKFQATIEFFKKYAAQYDFDWLMIAAQAYQESGLDQSKRSSAGAVGIMQIKPSTARDPNVNIPNVDNLEDNIHAGIKYLRFITDRYFSDTGIDSLNSVLLAFASYNAGPARVSRLRREADEKGLDPNLWYDNVELIAARRIGRETVQYVSNIYKYYLSYRLLAKHLQTERAQITGGE